MVDKALIVEWCNAASGEWKELTAAFAKENITVNGFEWGDGTNCVNVTAGEKLEFQARTSLPDTVDTPRFTLAKFMEMVEFVNTQITSRWKYIEEFSETRKGLFVTYPTTLRLQISSWRMLGKSIKDL